MNAGEAGAQILAAGLVDEVAMDVVPVVFGSGRRYFGGIDATHLLEDPHVVIQGDRVLHLKFKVRRWKRAISLGRSSHSLPDRARAGIPYSRLIDPPSAVTL